MRRLLVALACVLLAWTPAAAQVMKLHPAAGVSVSASTTLNPADKSSQITLSGGNLIATKNTAFSYASARSIASATTGKYYLECTRTTAPGSVVGIGAANSTASLANYLGVDNDSISALSTLPNLTANNANVGAYGATWNTIGAGVDVAIDVTNRKIWVRNRGGNWNNDVIANQNPATNTGGVAFPANMASGAVFIGVTVFDGAAPDAISVNFGASAFTDTPPSGFGNLS